MAIGDASGSNVDLINNLDAGNPLYLQNNDNSSLAIVNIKLVGAENYKIWAMAMKVALKGKNKMGFIDGTCVKQATSAFLSQQWERCNAIVLGWILGSLSQELYVGQAYSEISSEVWNESKETYDKMDGSVVFNLMHKSNNLRQGDLYVPDYYHKLNSLWREYDILTMLPSCVCENRPACTCDAKSGSTNHTQLIRLMQFLMGLNDVYQPIRSTILAKDPLPNIKDAFYVISREESHRGLHPGSSSSSKIQPAAFIAKTNNANNFNRRVNGNNKNNANRGPNPNLLCKNCGLIGHTIEMQTGNNNNKRFNSDSEVNHSVPGTSRSISSSFTNEQQMVKLLSLINEKPTKSSLSNNNVSFRLPNFYNNNVFVNLNFKRFFYAKTKSDKYKVTLGWIIDSRANQHMTDSTKNMFNVVDVSSLMLTVGHPNGTLVMISAAIGIVLFDVLVVPEYNVSLLSVNKMIKDSKFFVGFDEHKCYIQDLNLGKLVGTGSVTGGLYLFDLDKIGKSASSNSVFVCHVSSELWHCRLGHPADQAKQTREPFPLCDHKSKSVGDIVHCDVWGPYRVISKDGFKFFLTIVDDYSRAAYKLYSLDSKTVFYSRDVKFYENVFPFKMKNTNVFSQESNDENSLKFLDVQNPKSPYDEEGGTSIEDGNSRIASDDCSAVEDEVARDATHIEENVTSEGNVPVNQNGEGQSSPMWVSPELRRSTRPKVMPARFNDFVVNSSVRYGLEKYVYYNKLSKRNLCFYTTLNKTTEPKTFQEASQNPKWIEAMN
ncbi:ribonuclease H-like domain-containing protein, partial [Tanacetum coccineum]